MFSLQHVRKGEIIKTLKNYVVKRIKVQEQRQHIIYDNQFPRSPKAELGICTCGPWDGLQRKSNKTCWNSAVLRHLPMNIFKKTFTAQPAQEIKQTKITRHGFSSDPWDSLLQNSGLNQWLFYVCPFWRSQFHSPLKKEVNNKHWGWTAHSIGPLELK